MTPIFRYVQVAVSGISLATDLFADANHMRFWPSVVRWATEQLEDLVASEVIPLEDPTATYLLPIDVPAVLRCVSTHHEYLPMLDEGVRHCCVQRNSALGLDLAIDEEGVVTATIARPNTLAPQRFSADSKAFLELRAQMLRILGHYGLTVSQPPRPRRPTTRIVKRANVA